METLQNLDYGDHDDHKRAALYIGYIQPTELSEDTKLKVTVNPLCSAYEVALADYRVLGYLVLSKLNWYTEQNHHSRECACTLQAHSLL